MLVRFNVLECCSKDLHRCPLSRHSRIRRPWMLSPPFPCRQRRHKGHPFGSFIVRVSRNNTDVRCGVIHAGLWHRLYEWLREFLGHTFLETCLAPGGCCSLSIRIRWVLPRQLDPSDWLSSKFIETTCALMTWLPSVLLHGGRQAQLLFLIVAMGYFSSPPLMRMQALYLASFMSDVVKPYIEQTNDVTPGMSTSMDVSDRKAVTCQSDISATGRWNGFNFPFLKKHNVKSQQPRSMHAYQAVLSSSQPVSRSEWQQYSTQRCIVDDFRKRSRG